MCSVLLLQHKAESDGGSVLGMEEVASEEVIALVDQAVMAILTRLHSECIFHHHAVRDQTGYSSISRKVVDPRTVLLVWLVWSL